jgi:hypothetical protein
MSGKPGRIRTHRVLVLYSDEEFEELRQIFARSTSRSFSHYVRKVSLEEPMGMIVRNASFDAFIEEVIVLRKTMREVFREGKGKWSPSNQERLVQLHQEIKLVIDKIAALCTPH